MSYVHPLGPEADPRFKSRTYEPGAKANGAWSDARSASRARDGGGEESAPPKLRVDTLEEFVTLDLPRREHVLAPIIPLRGLAMLFAGRGVGKTHVGLGIAYAVASGGKFLRWHASVPRRILYVDGEMPAELFQERERALLASAPMRPPSADYFRTVLMDRQELGTSLNLALAPHQLAVEQAAAGSDLIVIDNLSTLVSGGRENDAESWDAMQGWLLHLRRSGMSVLLVHHAGRGGEARGTSKREDVLDTVIQLRRPEDYDPDQGARFEVHLTKARGVFGDDALPFEARLNVVNGADHWTCTTLRDREMDQVEEMTREKMAVREIAEATGLSKSTVNRMQAKLREQGRL